MHTFTCIFVTGSLICYSSCHQYDKFGPKRMKEAAELAKPGDPTSDIFCVKKWFMSLLLFMSRNLY